MADGGKSLDFPRSLKFDNFKMAEKINAMLMLEILGRPPEHIKKVLSEIVEKLGEEKDVQVISKKIAEPKEVKGEGDLFTSFAEVEIETLIDKLIAICFAYMPSHVELIKPEELRINNSQLNIILNELVRRLHQYDELAKALMIERQIIAKKVEEENIKSLKGEKGKTKNRKKSRSR